jgi:hypothetical protein
VNADTAFVQLDQTTPLGYLDQAAGWEVQLRSPRFNIRSS